MVTFEDLDKEKLAEAERLLRGKANTLGKDVSVHSEPFVRSDTIASGNIMMQTPSADIGLIAPNYDDFGTGGAVGTRYTNVRLHPHIPSGITGPDSVQAFIAISSAPNSHNYSDIEAVRLKPLISPKYSQGKANAAHADPNFRGFELALYPAKTNGGIGNALVADTDHPISPAADPGAGPPDDIAAGVGTDGFWAVDYDNGIVRFSRPPLNGSDGIMNPNDVFGDIEGIETASDGYGAITMFATFYHYTGEFGTPANLSFMTVGDGYVSSGIFTGADRNTLQAAIEELPDSGGTVFIKEGNYDYTTSVVIPKNVSIVGTGGVFILRPTTEPAFIIEDGYTTIENVEIQPRREGVVVSGGAIELRSTSASQVIKNVTIKDCVLYGEDDAPAIAFNPPFNCTYGNLTIENNSFEPGVTSGAIFIGERTTAAGIVTLRNSIITQNAFSTGNDISSTGISWTSVVGTIKDLKIVDNSLVPSDGGAVAVTINTGANDINRLNFSDNNVSNVSITCRGLLYATINSNNISLGTTTGLVLTVDSAAGSFVDVVISNNTIADDISITDSGASFGAYGLSISNNMIDGDIVISEPGNLQASTINNNTVGVLSTPRLTRGSSISGNEADDGIDVNFSDTSNAALTDSSVVDNRCPFGAIRINGAATTDSTTVVNRSMVSRNTVNSGNIDINGLVTLSTVNENYTAGSLTFGNLSTGAEVIENNASVLSATLMSGALIGNNKLSSSLTIINTTITSSNIIGNEIDGSANFAGTSIITSKFSDNIVSSSATFGEAIIRSIISDNIFTSTATFTDAATEIIDASEIVCNSFGGATTITGPFLDSKFKDGYITGALTFSQRVTNSDISSNRATTSISIAASSLISNSNISNNIASTTFTTGPTINTNIFTNRTTSDAYGAYFVGIGSRSGIMGIAGDTDADGVIGVGSGSGSGLYGFSGLNGGYGVLGVGAGGDAYGVMGRGSGSRAGIIGIAGEIDADGVVGIGSGRGHGIYGFGGSDGGSGGLFTGSTGDGYGSVFSGGLTNGAGLMSSGTGEGTGIIGIGGDTGYGILAQADISSPVKAALKLMPQDNNPTDGQQGDLYVNSSDGRLNFYDATSSSSGWQALARSADVQIFTSDGTWTKPANAKTVTVVCIGGGGGGGSGRRGANSTAPTGGGGGGGGAVTIGHYNASVLGTTETITVAPLALGGPEAGASSTDGNAGSDGYSSSFGTWQMAGGGGGGAEGKSGSQGDRPGGGGGGAIGNAAGSTGGTPNVASSAIGGQGVDANPASNAEWGGGSGGSSVVNAVGSAGGSSIYAAGGGGSGGPVNAGDGGNNGGDGGKSQSYTVGGGGAGGIVGVSGNGTAGASNSTAQRGYGGAGGGGGAGLGLIGHQGQGGDGGIPGGGGGGAGASRNGIGYGNPGGNGARGEVRVYTYF